MRRVATFIAGALAAAVMALTPAALAQEPAGPPEAPAAPAAPAAPDAPASAAAAPPASGTPLSLRPAPGALAPGGGGSTGITLQIGVVLALLVGGFFLWRRRATVAAAAPTPPKILSRTAVGVRSELLVVEIEGTKMLLGITPGSIQRLAVLSAPELAAPAELADPMEAAEPGFRSAWQREAAQAEHHDDPALLHAVRAAQGSHAPRGSSHASHASHAAPRISHGPAAARAPGASVPVGVALSPSVQAAFAQPAFAHPAKARGARPPHPDEGSGDHTLPGLGNSAVEEQARGLRNARSRA